MQHAINFGRIAAVLPVKNMDIAQQFYIDGLGFEKIFENGSPIGFVILKQGASELHLTLQPGYQAAHFPVAHLMVDDANALFTLCQNAGARIIKRLQDKEYGIRAFIFADPDGNRIDVGQRLKSVEIA